MVMKLIIIVILTCSGLLAMDENEKRFSAPIPKSIQRLLAGEKKKLNRRRSVPIALDLSLLKKVESYEEEFARENKEDKWDQEINYQEKAKKIKDKQKE